ncbi:MAG: terminase family protein [Patescibacteria group bacterium]|nr:terminase family protein [Patescibacteria group bacterium]
MDLPQISPVLKFDKNPLQEQFVFSTARRTAAAGAIRSGKTVGGGARVLFLCDLMPGSRFLIGRRDYTDLFNTTLKEILPLIEARNGADYKTPGQYVHHYDGTFHDLYLRTTGPDGQPGELSVLHFRHLKEVGKQLGMEISGYMIDQAEEIDEEVFAHIISRMSWWNEARRQAFKARYGFFPTQFEILTCNPDPGWIKGFLFEQDDENSSYFREEEDRFQLFETTTEHNRANLPPNYIEEMRRTHSQAWVERYIDGSWDIKGGAVYPEFNEAVHCIEEFKLPAHWKRFIALDWGYNHACSAHWGAVSEVGDLYVYDELFVRKMLVSQVAEQIHEKTERHKVGPAADDYGGLIVWMDPSTDQHHGVVERTVMGEFREHKIYGVPANNSVDAGINKVAERLKYDKEAKPPIKPTVFIFKKNCPNLVRGLKLYVWQPPNLQGISSGKPVKKDDDAADSFRYLVMAVLETTSSGAPPPAKTDDPMGDYILKTFLLGDGE